MSPKVASSQILNGYFWIGLYSKGFKVASSQIPNSYFWIGLYSKGFKVASQ